MVVDEVASDSTVFDVDVEAIADVEVIVDAVGIVDVEVIVIVEGVVVSKVIEVVVKDVEVLVDVVVVLDWSISGRFKISYNDGPPSNPYGSLGNIIASLKNENPITRVSAIFFHSTTKHTNTSANQKI